MTDPAPVFDADPWVQGLNQLYDSLKVIERKLDVTMGEVSHMASDLCEFAGGHRWEDREPDEMWVLPWKECPRCGSAHSQKLVLIEPSE